MAKIKGRVVVDTEPCSVLALSSAVNGKGYPYAEMANVDACTGCASCGIICPDSCIVVYRQKVE